mmetsp:Transcript_75317/g.207799  ORF Transcript_75317/g.207799 Transcript_75317/m.207799 type:complete len:100 (+) Transcript_75317:700-999(+)
MSAGGGRVPCWQSPSLWPAPAAPRALQAAGASPSELQLPTAALSAAILAAPLGAHAEDLGTTVVKSLINVAALGGLLFGPAVVLILPCLLFGKQSEFRS